MHRSSRARGAHCNACATERPFSDPSVDAENRLTFPGTGGCGPLMVDDSPSLLPPRGPNCSLMRSTIIFAEVMVAGVLALVDNDHSAATSWGAGGESCV